MRKALAGFLLLLSVTTFAVGDLSIDVPQKTKVYEFVRATVKSQDASTSYLWKVFRRQQIEAKDGTLFTVETRISPASAWVSQGKLVFVGPPGEYRVNLMAVSLDATTKLPKIEETDSLTTIEGEVPPAPPQPPIPPTPDAFAKSIQDAYAAETDPAKAAQFAFYKAVFAGAAPLVDASTTTSDLFTRLSQALHAPGVGIPQGSLPAISKVVGTYLNSELGTNPAAVLDKVKAKAALAKITAALNTVNANRRKK